MLNLLGTSFTELMKCISYWSNKSSKFEKKIKKVSGEGTQKNKEQQFSHQHKRGRAQSLGFSQLCVKFGYMSPNSL